LKIFNKDPNSKEIQTMLEKDKEKQKYENNTQIDMKMLNTFSNKVPKSLQVKINASNVYNVDDKTSITKSDKNIVHLQEENKPSSRKQKTYLLFI